MVERNFVQLCMEGYYNGCTFFRVVKNFIAQTGDRSETGEGGESVYGKTFKNESHSRLKFNRRGLVACATGNDQNNSQFFITLDKCEEIERTEYTIFGRVTPDTIYNILKVNEFQVDPKTEKPLFPPSILSAKIIQNPFPDISPSKNWNDLQTKNQQPQLIQNSKSNKNGTSDTPKQTKKTKNLKLLSFGEEEEEEGEESSLSMKGSYHFSENPLILKQLQNLEEEKEKKRQEEKKKQEERKEEKREKEDKKEKRKEKKEEKEKKKEEKEEKEKKKEKKEKKKKEKKKEEKREHSVLTEEQAEAEFEEMMRRAALQGKSSTSVAKKEEEEEKSSKKRKKKGEKKYNGTLKLRGGRKLGGDLPAFNKIQEEEITEERKKQIQEYQLQKLEQLKKHAKKKQKTSK